LILIKFYFDGLIGIRIIIAASVTITARIIRYLRALDATCLFIFSEGILFRLVMATIVIEMITAIVTPDIIYTNERESEPCIS